MSWWGLLRSPFATVGFLADIGCSSHDAAALAAFAVPVNK